MVGGDVREEPGKGTAIPAAPTLHALFLLPKKVWGRGRTDTQLLLALGTSELWHRWSKVPLPWPHPPPCPFPKQKDVAQPEDRPDTSEWLRGAGVALGLKHHPINGNVPRIPRLSREF